MNPPPPRSFADRLLAAAGSPAGRICLGLDPDLERIPFWEGSKRATLVRFCLELYEGLAQAGLRPGAAKPNYAFFAQYGQGGLQALRQVVGDLRRRGCPVILDAKRGDVGHTARAYAREVFEVYQADAVTLNPYLGEEALLPFLAPEYADRGAYIVCRTTNPGSADIQLWGPPHRPLYLEVVRLVGRLAQQHPGRVGAVVGANTPEALGEVASRLGAAGPAIPLLIPGIGPQGGSLQALPFGMGDGELGGIHRVTLSRLLMFAHETRPELGVGGAAAAALRRLLQAAPAAVPR